MNTMTRTEILIRGLLTVGVAALGFLAVNDTWASIVGKVGLMLTGLILVVLQAWRGFLDKSTAQGEQAEPTKVTVENTTADPVPTEPVDSAPNEDEPATALDHGV